MCHRTLSMCLPCSYETNWVIKLYPFENWSNGTHVSHELLGDLNSFISILAPSLLLFPMDLCEAFVEHNHVLTTKEWYWSVLPESMHWVVECSVASDTNLCAHCFFFSWHCKTYMLIKFFNVCLFIGRCFQKMPLGKNKFIIVVTMKQRPKIC